VARIEKRADGRSACEAGALPDRRRFVLDPERWAVFQAALDADAAESAAEEAPPDAERVRVRERP